MGAEIIAPILTKLYTASLSNTIVISDWKVSKVTPVYNGKSNNEEAGNYRPISLIGHIMKIFEKEIKTLCNMSDGNVTAVCSFEITTCFDTINHSILFKKLVINKSKSSVMLATTRQRIPHIDNNNLDVHIGDYKLVQSY